MLFVMVTGRIPYNTHKRINKIIQDMKEQKFTNNDNWTYISSDLKDLIKSLMVYDINKRLTIDEVLNHPWILNGEYPKISNYTSLKRKKCI